MNREHVHNWVHDFQRRVDCVTNFPVGESLVRFTAVMWGDNDGGFDSDLVEMHSHPAFPFLDMEMLWAENDELHFQVHLKRRTSDSSISIVVAIIGTRLSMLSRAVFLYGWLV